MSGPAKKLDIEPKGDQDLCSGDKVIRIQAEGGQISPADRGGSAHQRPKLILLSPHRGSLGILRKVARETRDRVLGKVIRDTMEHVTEPQSEETRQLVGRSLRLLRTGLLSVDVLLVVLSLAGAFWLRVFTRFLDRAKDVHVGPSHFWILAGFTILILYLYTMHGLYRASNLSRRYYQAVSIFKSVSLAAAILLTITYLTKTRAFVERRAIIVLSWGLLISTECLVRCYLVQPLVRRFLKPLRVLVLGVGDCARRIASRFTTMVSPESFELVGLLATSDGSRADSVHGVPVLGGLENLREIVERYGIDEVFIADLSLEPEGTLEMISLCRGMDVGIRVASGLFEPILPQIEAETLDTIPLVRLRRRPFVRVAAVAKRILDLLGAGIGLFLTSPLFLLFAIWIKLSSKGPVFFVQERVGQRGAPFNMLKFRTMKANADSSVHRDYASRFINGDDVAQTCVRTKSKVNKLVHDDRVTRVGRFLRRFSLDELPQLINVLKGEMSLVGPRPPIDYEVELYRDWHKKRLDVVPGLTGLWQVSGRNRLSFQEMVLLDLYYAENWSVAMDLKILLRTIPAVFDKATY